MVMAARCEQMVEDGADESRGPLFRLLAQDATPLLVFGLVDLTAGDRSFRISRAVRLCGVGNILLPDPPGQPNGARKRRLREARPRPICASPAVPGRQTFSGRGEIPHRRCLRHGASARERSPHKRRGQQTRFNSEADGIVRMEENK